MPSWSLRFPKSFNTKHLKIFLDLLLLTEGAFSVQTKNIEFQVKNINIESLDGKTSLNINMANIAKPWPIKLNLITPVHTWPTT